MSSEIPKDFDQATERRIESMMEGSGFSRAEAEMRLGLRAVSASERSALGSGTKSNRTNTHRSRSSRGLEQGDHDVEIGVGGMVSDEQGRKGYEAVREDMRNLADRLEVGRLRDAVARGEITRPQARAMMKAYIEKHPRP